MFFLLYSILCKLWPLYFFYTIILQKYTIIYYFIRDPCILKYLFQNASLVAIAGDAADKNIANVAIDAFLIIHVIQ